MMSEAEVKWVLDRLTSIQREGDPGIAQLLAVVPELRRLDWLNRCGLRTWERIAAELRTDVLEWLTKVLVIAEREFDWVGGSVAAPIWLYQAYSSRADADPDALADWVLRNRGRNDYVPFGRRTSVRSVKEWHIEQQARARGREEQRQIEDEKKKLKSERARETMVRSAARREKGKLRWEALETRLRQFRNFDAETRLRTMGSDPELPLETIPAALVVECVPMANSVDQETKQLVLRRMGRRTREPWKALRAALTS
jgi:hypothetical protein